MDGIPEISFNKKQNDKIEFEIMALSSLFSRKDNLVPPIDKPHRVGFYQILFITKGEGIHFIDFQPYPYQKGSLIFISKGQVHAFDVRPENDGFLILFTESFLSKNMIHSDLMSFSRLYNYHLHLPVIQLEETADRLFNKMITDMHNEYLFHDTFAKEDILQLMLKLLLLRAERIKRTVLPKEKNSDWMIKFGQFKTLIEQYFNRTRDAKKYARMMDISYKHLNDISKSITGMTAKKMIDNFLILESKRLMAISDISIKELTYELGFDEPTNFVKFFKKHTAATPSQFKKNLKQ